MSHFLTKPLRYHRISRKTKSSSEAAINIVPSCSRQQVRWSPDKLYRNPHTVTAEFALKGSEGKLVAPSRHLASASSAVPVDIYNHYSCSWMELWCFHKALTAQSETWGILVREMWTQVISYSNSGRLETILGEVSRYSRSTHDRAGLEVSLFRKWTNEEPMVSVWCTKTRSLFSELYIHATPWVGIERRSGITVEWSTVGRKPDKFMWFYNQTKRLFMRNS